MQGTFLSWEHLLNAAGFDDYTQTFINKSLHTIAPSEHGIQLEFLSDTARTTFEDLYLPELERHTQQSNISLTLQVKGQQLTAMPEHAAVQPAQPVSRPIPQTSVFTLYEHLPRRVLNRFSPQKFIRDTSNIHAHNSTMQVVQEESTIDGLLIQGNVGNGKTHLIHCAMSIAHQAGLRVHYCKAEQFAIAFTNALAKTDKNDRHVAIETFRAHYACDLLVIDDLQMIAKRFQAALQELDFLLDSITQSGGQYILTSRVAISKEQLPENSLRLLKRLQGTMTTMIAPPSAGLCQQLINRTLSKSPQITLPADCQDYLIAQHSVNIRNFVSTLSFITNLEDPTCTLSQLKTQLPATKQESLTSADIFRAISQVSGFSLEDLRANNRAQQVVKYRHIAMYLLRHSLQLSFSDIGKLLNKKHTSCIHAEKKIKQLLDTDKTTRNLVEKMKESFE